MEKNFTDYNFLLKQEAQKNGYTIVDKKNLKEIMGITTPAFETYPLYKYFTPKFNIKAWTKFKWRVFKAMYKDAVIITDSTKSFSAVVLCNNYVKTKKSDYILNGIWKSHFSMGFGAMKRINKFEEFALEVRKKHTNCDAIYCFDLGVKKEAQHKGIGKKVCKLIQEFCDKYQRDAFFETHSEQNVQLYKKFGFTLVDTLPIPDIDGVLHYCFMYKHKTKHK